MTFISFLQVPATHCFLNAGRAPTQTQVDKANYRANVYHFFSTVPYACNIHALHSSKLATTQDFFGQ